MNAKRFLPLLLSGSFLFAIPAFAGAETWRGHVSDRKCGAKIDAECNKRCIDGGEPPILVIDGTGEIWTIANPAALISYAGGHVEVTGSRSESRLTIDSVAAIAPARPTGRNNPETAEMEEVCGNYRIAAGHEIGIDRFVGDDGTSALLFSDYESGDVRRLFPTSDGTFTVGPAFAVAAPPELLLRFVRTSEGDVSGLAFRRPGDAETFAARLPIREEPVTFPGDHASLAGTLLLPEKIGRHPAIILLHGSGPLTRYSFGPYPRFFASLGLAVLIYDKRGAGASTGVWQERGTRYPDDLAGDAMAAFRFLRSRDDIDPARVGFWGSSEGGMLATQVAAFSKDVAFVINSSGFMMPLWRQMIYQIEAKLRADGVAAREVREAVAFEELRMKVGRTGKGWPKYRAMWEKLRRRKWFPSFFDAAGESPSLEEMRWEWSHVFRFDPLPAVRKVTCPVLGLFGELDLSTPAAVAAANMRQALAEGGNDDVTVKIFRGANHALTEAKTGRDAETPTLRRQVPGLFELLRSWLSERMRLPPG